MIRVTKVKGLERSSCPLYKAQSALLTPIDFQYTHCALFRKCPNSLQEKVGESIVSQREMYQWLLVFLFFRALFTSGWNNTEKKVYNIPGISPDMMKLIIEYAYTRTVPITPDNVEKLLAAADQFNIMGIVRGCCEFLKSELCLDNCIGICKFTDYYYCPELRQKAYMFILHNFEEMVKVSAEFLELSVSELKDIIEKDELNVKQEDAVFEAILKWISHDPQNRKQHISVLLPKVKFNYFLWDA